jgi:hypothetical protein
MAITKDKYQYSVVQGDSLVKIADKHGLTPALDWARKIWSDEKNKQLHTNATMNGNKRKRQVHDGNNKYIVYEPSKFTPGNREYDKPDQIILYAGEKVWIPETKREHHEITDDELINGFVPEFGKKYELVFPVYEIIIELEEDEYEDADKYTLCGFKKENTSNALYKKTVTIGNDAIKEEGAYPKFRFVGTPTNLLYSLECVPSKPITDDDGKTITKYFVFENRRY